MDEPAQSDTEQAVRKAPFQFGLKHLLAAPVWVALLLAAGIGLGAAGVALFLLASIFAVGIWQRSCAWIATGVVLTLVLFCLLIPAIDGGPPHPRSQCANNLKQIGLALHNYHDHYRCFPPAYIADENGRPMHSWRVLILPFIEQEPLYELYRFDEPWDGPNNRKLAEWALPVFNCPSNAKEPSTATNYLAVVGPSTAWPGGKSTTWQDFADGTSNTLLVVEVADSGVHWMEPRDLHVVQMAPTVNSETGQGISSAHPGGANVLFVDGATHFLSETISPEELRALLTIAGGEPVGQGALAR